MAACSKEEPKKICDCNSPKPHKMIIQGQVRAYQNNDLTVYFGGVANQTNIICNTAFLNTLLKNADVKKDSIISLEVLANKSCNSQGSSVYNLFIDVLSIKNDSLR